MRLRANQSARCSLQWWLVKRGLCPERNFPSGLHLQLQTWPRFQLHLGWSLLERCLGTLLRILQTLVVRGGTEERVRNAGINLDSSEPAYPNFLKGLRIHSRQIPGETHWIHMSTYTQREKNQRVGGQIVVPKTYAQILNCGTCGGGLLWKQVFADVIKDLEMRSRPI